MDEGENVKSTPKMDLERLSVDELTSRIEELACEISACEAEIAKKMTHKSAADALFGKSD